MTSAPRRGRAPLSRPVPGPGTLRDGLERILYPIFTPMRRLRWYHPRVASFLRVFGSIGRIRRGTLVASLSWTRRRRAGYAARGPTAPHAGLSTPEAGASFRRADAHPTRSFIRLLGSEDHGRGLRRREVPSGVAPRGLLRTPNAAIPHSSIGTDPFRPWRAGAKPSRGKPSLPGADEEESR